MRAEVCDAVCVRGGELLRGALQAVRGARALRLDPDIQYHRLDPAPRSHQVPPQDQIMLETWRSASRSWISLNVYREYSCAGAVVSRRLNGDYELEAVIAQVLRVEPGFNAELLKHDR